MVSDLSFLNYIYDMVTTIQQRGFAIVCMMCRKLTKVDEVPKECCKNYGFPVDPKSVVIDKTTGKVTHAAPLSKREISKNA